MYLTKFNAKFNKNLNLSTIVLSELLYFFTSKLPVFFHPNSLIFPH